MSPKTFKNKIILILATILCLLIGTAFFLILSKPRHLSLTVDPTGQIAPTLTGDFTLTDEDGKTVTPATYMGQYKLIFFGFTHCPSICPTEMLKMADVMSALPGEQAARITPLFITVDPTRDTPDSLKKYTDSFSPHIIGLTGSDAQIRAAIDTFKVYASRVDMSGTPDNTPSTQNDIKTADSKKVDYTYDHSTFLYLFSPDHQLIKLYRMEDTAEFIAGDLKGIFD